MFMGFCRRFTEKVSKNNVRWCVLVPRTVGSNPSHPSQFFLNMFNMLTRAGPVRSQRRPRRFTAGLQTASGPLQTDQPRIRQPVCRLTTTRMIVGGRSQARSRATGPRGWSRTPKALRTSRSTSWGRSISRWSGRALRPSTSDLERVAPFPIHIPKELDL